MKPIDYADLLGVLDDRFLTEAHAVPRRPRRLWVTLAAVLPLICLIAIGTTAYAATESGQWILDIFTRRHLGPDYSESGYRLDFALDRVPASELSPELLALGDDIVEAIRAYRPHMSHIPNIQYRRFTDADEAAAFIGYAPLRMPELASGETQITVSAWGDERGNIGRISVETYFDHERLIIQSFAALYTPHHRGSVGTGVATTDWENYTSNEYLTPSGLNYLVVRSLPMDEDPSERRHIDAYLIRDSIFYHLHLAHDVWNEAEAEAVLAEWVSTLD